MTFLGAYRRFGTTQTMETNNEIYGEGKYIARRFIARPVKLIYFIARWRNDIFFSQIGGAPANPIFKF